MRATWLGGIFLAGDMALFYSAVKLTSIVDVTVIGAFQPALVLIAARRLFGERMGRWDVAWIVLAMTGVAVAVLGPGVASHHQLIGDLLAVGTLVSFSAYWLVSKHARQLHDALEYTAGVTIMAAVAITPIVLLSSESLGHVKVGDWLWIFLLTVVPGSGHLVMNWPTLRRRIGLLSDQLPEPARCGRCRDSHSRSAPEPRSSRWRVGGTRGDCGGRRATPTTRAVPLE